jgi:predicted dehydrogenase
MYVTGRGDTGVGTLLSSIAQSSKDVNISDVTIAAISPKNADVVNEATNRINGALGSTLNVNYVQISGKPEVDIPQICKYKKYDCIIVCTPDHLHYGYTLSAFDQGLHVLVVKPLTPTLEEAVILEKKRASLGLYAAVEFHKRWDVTNLWIRKAIGAGQVGKLLYFTVDYSQKITIPLETFSQWADKTNIFQYLGVHYVDLIWYLTGFRPVKVMASGVHGRLKEKGLSTWDAVLASIVWESPSNKLDRFISQFSTSWVDPVCTSALSDQKYKVIGTKGRIECDQKNRGVEFVQEDQGIQQINPYFSEFIANGEVYETFGGYGHESIKQFIMDVRNIKSGKISPNSLEKVRPTFRDALVSTAVVDAVNKSLLSDSSWREIDEIL